VELSPKTDRNVGFQRYDFGFRAGNASILAAHAFLANRKSHWNLTSHADSRMLQIVIFGAVFGAPVFPFPSRFVVQSSTGKYGPASFVVQSSTGKYVSASFEVQTSTGKYVPASSVVQSRTGK
jgi:hypothetical protein